MKISFLCLAIYAYVAYASEESESGKPETKHAVQSNVPSQGYVPYGSNPVRPPPGYYPPRPQPQPRRRGGLDLSNPIILYLLLRALRPTTTTAATTMAPTTTAAPDPLAGWTKFGSDNCYYRLSDTTATWAAADNECKGAITNGRLAVSGFNVLAAERTSLISALTATGVTFFIGADAAVTGCATCTLGSSAAFIAPLDGIDVTTGDPSFTAVLADSVTADGPVCGRVDAADNSELVFEDCTTTARRYMCEVCT